MLLYPTMITNINKRDSILYLYIKIIKLYFIFSKPRDFLTFLTYFSAVKSCKKCSSYYIKPMLSINFFHANLRVNCGYKNCISSNGNTIFFYAKYY